MKNKIEKLKKINAKILRLENEKQKLLEELEEEKNVIENIIYGIYSTNN